ncbi:sensor histidine kinase [Sphingosinithalassobacter portus]|uniref:sensor histidine kinase n=1 Tax=Stakelama portus TaxID=2676234 RepID=UPI000D6DD303|nr:HAMP domain-containing sensor histidine kinase [Sphingosinithalassobacter portus]
MAPMQLPPPMAGLIETRCDRIASLEHALRQRNLLMATMGHDLKQPLQIILRAVERLAPETLGTTECLWADAAIEQVMRISDGLTQLADAAALSESHPGPDIRRRNLSDIFADLQRNWRLSAAEAGVDLRFVPRSGLVCTDDALVCTILGNLIGNALKHGRGAPVLVGARRCGDTMVCIVQDRGPGIEAGLQRRMFVPGVRGATRSPGMGLGLALVRQLADELGHPLSFISRPGAGTRFALALPCAK